MKIGKTFARFNSQSQDQAQTLNHFMNECIKTKRKEKKTIAISCR